jgi:hypothetical protein
MVATCGICISFDAASKWKISMLEFVLRMIKMSLIDATSENSKPERGIILLGGRASCK